MIKIFDYDKVQINAPIKTGEVFTPKIMKKEK
jgi:hypothetical protein